MQHVLTNCFGNEENQIIVRVAQGKGININPKKTGMF